MYEIAMLGAEMPKILSSNQFEGKMPFHDWPNSKLSDAILVLNLCALFFVENFTMKCVEIYVSMCSTVEYGK